MLIINEQNLVNEAKVIGKKEPTRPFLEEKSIIHWVDAGSSFSVGVNAAFLWATLENLGPDSRRRKAI